MAPAVSPSPATTKPTSPRGTMPQPMRVARARPSRSAPMYAPTNFDRIARTVIPRSRSAVSRLPQACDVHLSADEAKEERREECGDRSNLLLEGPSLARLPHHHPTQEGADDRRKTDERGDRGQAEHDDHAGKKWSVRKAGGGQQRPAVGQHARPAKDHHNDEEQGHPDQGRNRVESHAPRRDAGRDGEDHDREHVVDHGGAEDDPTTPSLQGAQVPQHVRGDPNTGGGKRGREEDRERWLTTGQFSGGEPCRERQKHAEHTDGERSGADPEQLMQAGLQPDLEEQ